MLRHLALGLLLLAPACASAPDDDESGLSESELRALTAAEIIGTLTYGETSAPVSYSKTPLYRAFKFDGQKGDVASAFVRSGNGDARGWLLGQNFATLAQNDDASPGVKDARLTLTLPTSGSYYVVFREQSRKNAAFTVSLSKSGGACGLPLVREGRWEHGSPTRPQGLTHFDATTNRLVVFTAEGTSERTPSGYTSPDGDPLPAGDRSEAAIAFDTARGRAVLFGGRDPQSNKPLGDTWEWQGGTWTKMAPAGPMPRARSGHALAYDPVRKNVVLFGGNVDDGPIADTWTWDGATWTRAASGTDASVPHPEPRYGHRMVFDETRGKVLLFGQYGPWRVGPVGSPNTSAGNTWTWNGSSWSPLPGATASFSSDNTTALPMVYDAARKRVLRVGTTGGRYQESYQLLELVSLQNGAAWSPIAVAGGSTPKVELGYVPWLSGAFDNASGRFVFGAPSGSGPGWEFGYTELANRAPVLEPVANGRVFVGDMISVSLKATDADGHRITYRVSPMPPNATLNAQTGGFFFTPAANQVGTLSLKASASDGCDVHERDFQIKVEIGVYAGMPTGSVRLAGEVKAQGDLQVAKQYSAYPSLACRLEGDNPGKLLVSCDGRTTTAYRSGDGSYTFTPVNVSAPLEQNLTFASQDANAGTFSGHVEPLVDGTYRLHVEAWTVPLVGVAGRVVLRGTATGVLDVAP